MLRVRTADIARRSAKSYFVARVKILSQAMLEKGESRSAFTSREKLRVLLLYAPIALATTVGFLLATIIGNASMVFAGLATIAYVFGLRHGIDVDHIVAIDNTTRKLMHEGKRPLTVGTWFSLGHSMVVTGLTVALVLSARAVVRYIPELQSGGALLGTIVSGIFLWIIGLVNVVIIVGIVRIIHELKHNKTRDKSEIDDLLNKRGFLNRYLHPLFRIVKEPKQIFPIGILFGLGFDTATEVALIAISVAVGLSATVPLWAILILPFMFTCGMVLVDTTDGVAMTLAYGWAFIKPIRKIYYNLTMTAISVIVAFVIGSVELLQVLSRELVLKGALWQSIGSVDFSTVGIMILAIFGASWLIAMSVYKIKGIDRVENSSNIN